MGAWTRRASLAGLVFGAWLAAGVAHAGGVSFQHTPPARAIEGLPVHITGNVSGAGEISRARVFYRRPGGRFSQVDLRPAGGDAYEAVIPGRDVRPPALEYYVVATDLLGRRQELFASESNPQSIRVSADDDDAPAPDAARPRAQAPSSASPRSTSPSPGAGRAAPCQDQPSPEPDAGAPSELEQELAMYGAEDVVSLATKHEQVVSDAPAIASSLSDDELAQRATRIVPDALKTMPGFDVSRDFSSFYRIAVRGLRADPEVLVLYDGHALNSPYDGRPLLAIPTDTLERVEVVRGPSSALYGTGAFLGAVNLVSKRRDEVAASFRGGSFSTFQGSANAGHTWGHFGLFADGSVDTSKGYKAPIETDFNSAALESQGLKASDAPAGFTDDHHTLINVGAEARAELGAGTFSLSGRVLKQTRGALGGLYDTVGPGSKLDWTVILADANWRKPIGAGAVAARLFFDQQQTSRFFQLTPADASFSLGGVSSATGLQQKDAFTTRTLGAELSAEIALHPTNQLDVGFTALQQSLPSFSYQSNYVESGGIITLLPGLQAPSTAILEDDAAVNRRGQLGVYAQDQWRPVKPLSLTLGVRADAIQLPNVSGAGTGQVDGKRFVVSVNPRLGVVVTALPNLNFKLLYGRAFRAPTIQELASSAPQDDYAGVLDSGNPQLVPATVDTVELGAEHVLSTVEGKLRLRGDVFWNRFSNPILAVDTSGNDTPLQNRDPGIDVKGAELELRFEASARASAFVNFSYAHAVDLAALAPQFEHLTDVPQIRTNIGFQFPVGRYLNFDLLCELAAERRNSDLSKLEALHHYDIPAYALVSAQVRTETLFGHFQVALAGYNVLQQSYVDDVPRPDRVTGLLPGPSFAAELQLKVRL